MSKTVCYTCITGSYDNIAALDDSITCPDIDFICFTDMPVKLNKWHVFPVPSDLQGLSNVKQQRLVKICPHKYFQNYDISVWIDGNFQIIDDLKQFIAQYDLNKVPLYTRIHQYRDCIYSEAEACIQLHKDTSFSVMKQIERYKAEGYPKHIGMSETGILLRKHNDLKCKLLCNLWASELLLGSHRDQLSFNYACWKQHFIPGCLKNEFSLKNNKFFKLHKHLV